MIRARAIVATLCVCALLTTLGGCATPVVDGMSGVGDGGSSASSENEAAKAGASRVVMAVIAARNEDRREANGTLRTRGPGSTPCPFGGSRSTDENGITTFVNCGMLPGVTLNGGIRFTPGPEGTQGGRIEFMDLEGTYNGNPFSVDGTIEETENADGSLSFDANVKTSQTGDGETDEFNLDGEVKVNEDGTMEGNMRVDTGADDRNPNDCDFNGFNIFSLQEDERALNGPCGFDKEELDDDEGDDTPDDDTPDDDTPDDDTPDDDTPDDDSQDPECDCAPGEECIEFQADDGTLQTFCSNCETNEDCVRKGLGNECSLGLTCTTVECFTNDDCPDGFECDSFLGGGECVEKSIFPFPL
jgi:hypothetical protein